MSEKHSPSSKDEKQETPIHTSGLIVSHNDLEICFNSMLPQQIQQEAPAIEMPNSMSKESSSSKDKENTNESNRASPFSSKIKEQNKRQSIQNFSKSAIQNGLAIKVNGLISIETICSVLQMIGEKDHLLKHMGISQREEQDLLHLSSCIPNQENISVKKYQKFIFRKQQQTWIVESSSSIQRRKWLLLTR